MNVVIAGRDAVLNESPDTEARRDRVLRANMTPRRRQELYGFPY